MIFCLLIHIARTNDFKWKIQADALRLFKQEIRSFTFIPIQLNLLKFLRAIRSVLFNSCDTLKVPNKKGHFESMVEIRN